MNGPMLAIARARGFAVAERMDPATTRVVVSTTGGMPSWPPFDGRRRVLVEAGGFGWRGEGELRKAGYEVLTCPGPRAGHTQDCPLLANDRCPLVDGADAVVLALATDREPGASLLAVHRSRPGAPSCVEATGFGSTADAVASVRHRVETGPHPAVDDEA